MTDIIYEVVNLYYLGIKGYNRMNGVVCGINGISQAIRTKSGGHNEVKIIEDIEPKEIGHYSYPNSNKKHQSNTVYDKEYISPTLDTMEGGNRQPKIIEDVTEPCICASRGRNPENPSDRNVGIDTEQRLEINSQGTSNTLTSVQKNNLVIEPSVKKIGETTPNSQAGAVYDISGVSQTLTACTHGYAMGNIAEPTIIQNAHGFNKGAELSLSPTITSNSFENNNFLKEPKLVGGIGEINWGKQYHQGNRIYDSEEIAMCLNSQPVGNAGGNSYLYQVEKPTYRIRKLTPKECIRLMNFDDGDYEKIKEIGMSDSQIYKQCGNSIVVACLEKIFDKMFVNTETTEPVQLTLF